MNFSARRDVLYEINTYVWLNRLSIKYDQPIDLGNVPDDEWDHLAGLGFNAIWLMGVWQRSPQSKAVALAHSGISQACRNVLPGFHADDCPGSPYSIRAYVPDARIGDVATARAALARRGLKLILDFVPNHVAADHPWVSNHPEYFIQGSEDDLASAPEKWFRNNGSVIAYGRDPYFPSWTDTAQLNVFSPAVRQKAIETLREVAELCDGVRCDMAMLVLNDVFHHTWADAAGQLPTLQYWTELIQSIRSSHPEFIFIAEAYWNREWELQQLGFNYCYDKRLYDRLVHEDAPAVKAHLVASLDFQEHLLRFLENHDEPRAAAIMPPLRHKAAAVVTALLPGATLYHDGQFGGAKMQLPVQLGRAPVETYDAALASFYSRLRHIAATVKRPQFNWNPAPANGWNDNHTAENLLGWAWSGDPERFLIVVNFSDSPAQGQVSLPWHDLAASNWRLIDLMNERAYERHGRELQERGLYVDLAAWDYYVFRLEPLDESRPAVS